MQSEDIPDWMRLSSYRDLVGNGRMLKVTILVVSIILCVVFLIASYILARDRSGILFLPILGAGICIIIACTIGIAQTRPIMIVTYLFAAAIANSAIVHVATLIYSNGDRISALTAISEVIFFTGIIGLLQIEKTHRRISKMTEIAIMIFCISMTIGGLCYVHVPSEGTYQYLRLWLLSAIIPMTILTFMAFAGLVTHHKGERTYHSQESS